MSETGLYEEVVIAGFGGQGIILLGKLLAQIAMKAGKEVTYMPSYGAEMRGGTANSMIIISDEPIANPMVTNPNSLIIMNKASLEKFAPRIKSPGLIVYNSSLISQEPKLDEKIETLPIPADDIAKEIGSPRSANMVALGAYLQRRQIFSYAHAADCVKDVLAKRYHNTLTVNAEALKRGAQFAESFKPCKL
jgi:2-oxoglutarate ferredoxin oxidoreductase subunit gamma